MVKMLWKKEDRLGTQPPTMENYTEAASKFIKSATALMKHARVFAEAKWAFELWQKEIELVRVRKEIDALKLVIPLLVEHAAACPIEYATLGKSDAVRPAHSG